MKRKLNFFILTLCFIITTNVYAEKVPKEIVDFVHMHLKSMGKDPIIVQAVKQENSKGKIIADIKILDKKWIATPGISDFMKSLMISKCAIHIADIQKKNSFYSEIFIMDKLGANIAMTDKTSDYWQGDEAKFIKCFNQGDCQIYTSDVEYDDSALTYLVHASIPVYDENHCIGVITIGIDVDDFLENSGL